MPLKTSGGTMLADIMADLPGVPPDPIIAEIIGDGAYDTGLDNPIVYPPLTFDCEFPPDGNVITREWLYVPEHLGQINGSYQLDLFPGGTIPFWSADESDSYQPNISCMDTGIVATLGASEFPIPDGGQINYFTLGTRTHYEVYEYFRYNHVLTGMNLELFAPGDYLPCWSAVLSLSTQVGLYAIRKTYTDAGVLTGTTCINGASGLNNFAMFVSQICCPRSWDDLNGLVMQASGGTDFPDVTVLMPQPADAGTFDDPCMYDPYGDGVDVTVTGFGNNIINTYSGQRNWRCQITF